MECKIANSGPFVIEVKLGSRLSFYFTKNCLSGIRKDLEVMIWGESLEEEGVSIMNEGVPLEDFQFKNPSFKLEAEEGDYTEFYINTWKGDQYLERITILSSKSAVLVELKGEGKGGGAIHDEGLEFSLFYYCQ